MNTVATYVPKEELNWWTVVGWLRRRTVAPEDGVVECISNLFNRSLAFQQ
jgi:hypothetical protein